MRESLEAVGRFDPQRARARFLESFNPTDTHHIVVKDKDVGFMVVSEKDEVLVLAHLYIEPAHQGSGIGAVALKLVQNQAALRGQSVQVGALKGSRSNHFYQRHGFRPLSEGEWDNFYVWHAPSVA